MACQVRAVVKGLVGASKHRSLPHISSFMEQLVAFDSDDAQRDIVGEKTEAASSLPPARIPLTPKEESQLWFKVDLRLMPIIALMYLLCFMDRGTFFTRADMMVLHGIFRKYR